MTNPPPHGRVDAQPAAPGCLVITSDVHLSAPDGRWPHTTGRFRNLLRRVQRLGADGLFIVGDIVDNAVDARDGVVSGTGEHWQREVEIYQSLKDAFPRLRFLQALGVGHDGDPDRLGRDGALATRSGVFSWKGFDLIWFTVDQELFPLDAPGHHDVLTEPDAAWLREQLRHSHAAILLFHVPLRTAETLQAGQWTNGTNLTIDPRDSLYRMIDEYADRIVAIFSGHIHRPIRSQYGHIPLYVCPFIESGCHSILSVHGSALDVRVCYLAEPEDA